MRFIYLHYKDFKDYKDRKNVLINFVDLSKRLKTMQCLLNKIFKTYLRLILYLRLI